MNNVKVSGNKYWEAVANEFYGYLHLAKNNKDQALDYFTRAQYLYEHYGRLNNGEGSNEALAGLIESLNNNEVQFISSGNSSANTEEYNRLMKKYNEVVQERDDLKSVLIGLKKDIADLRKMNKDLQAKVDACLAFNDTSTPLPITGITPSTPATPRGKTPWENTNEEEFDNRKNKWLVMQAGAGNIFKFEQKLKFGIFEIGGFIDLSREYSIYGGILTTEVYKGKDWDAPFDLTFGYSTTGVGPFIDGYAGFRYYFLNNYGVFVKGGYNMAYIMNLVPVSYFNFSAGAIFRL